MAFMKSPDVRVVLDTIRSLIDKKTMKYKDEYLSEKMGKVVVLDEVDSPHGNYVYPVRDATPEEEKAFRAYMVLCDYLK